MISAIIIDDEKRSQSTLLKLLDRIEPDVTVVSMAASVDEGVRALNEHKPDLLFLDINMPGESGFEVLEKIENLSFDVIFTTAHDEYAVSAIKCGALDYLLKPISIKELDLAVKKSYKRIHNKSFTSNPDVKNFLAHINPSNMLLKKIPVASLHGLSFIDSDELIRCSADNNYTMLHLKEGKTMLASKTLKDYENILKRYGFFRCHRSHLINLDYIEEYKKGKPGYILMSDGFQVDIANSRKAEFYKLVYSN